MDQTTKDRIVEILRELMKEKPLRKLKVQDVMKAAGMTRQCFYYHFQDIYQAVEWEVDRKLRQHVRYSPGQDFGAWIAHVLEEINEDPDFYRRVAKNIEYPTIRRFFKPVIVPSVNDFLFGDAYIDLKTLPPEKVYAADVLEENILYLMLSYVSRRDPIPEEELEQRLRAILVMMEGIRQALRTM